MKKSVKKIVNNNVNYPNLGLEKVTDPRHLVLWDRK